MGEIFRDFECDFFEVEEKCGIVYFFDLRGVLRWVFEFCIKDCFWLFDELEVYFVSIRIFWEMCNYVGVKICREEVLWFYVVGIFFG